MSYEQNQQFEPIDLWEKCSDSYTHIIDIEYHMSKKEEGLGGNCKKRYKYT